MDKQVELFPPGLSRSQLNKLNEYASKAASLTLPQLLLEADRHLQETEIAYQTNRLINVRLATAIRNVIERIISDWEKAPAISQPWLAGAILYFAGSNDDLPDFSSPIGFEDDAEILNACLKFARLDELCLNPEDYDDV